MVRKQQIERLKQIKATRDNAKVAECLAKLTEALKMGGENLLSLAVEAARNRATLGEISDALEVVSEDKAQIRSFSGVYSKEIKTTKVLKKQNN